MKKYLLIFIILFSVYTFARPLPLYKWKSLIGWEVVDVKEITGWEDKDGDTGDYFEGCVWDRKIFFTDDTYLICKEYNYSLSYSPVAVIFKRYGRYKMLVNDNLKDSTLYDVGQW